MNQRTYIIVGIIALAAAGLGLRAYLESGAVSEKDKNPIVVEDGSQLGENIQVEKITPPSLDQKLVYPATMPLEIRKDTETKIKALIAELKTNPQAPAVWNELGLYYKLLGNNEASREVWEYAIALLPTYSSPYSNLAELYITTELKNNAKAEENLLLAIKYDVTVTDYYFDAYNFYVNVVKDRAKAKAILQAGVKALPKDESLKETLANHK